MKKISLTSMFLLSLALAGCAGPRINPMLDQARAEYGAARANPNVVALAPAELQQAGDALNQAERSFNEREDAEKTDRLAYTARQRAMTAQEIARARAAERTVAAAAKLRDEMRIEQRTLEADRAKAAANAAEAQARAAQSDAQRAQQAAMMSQADAEAARRAALSSQAQAQDAESRARALEAQLQDLAARQTERGMVMTLGDVLFALDQAALTPNGMRTVQKLATFMQNYPQRTVLVEGFTDSTGGAAYNMELSQRRADAVAGALAGMGIDRARIATRAYGEAYPVAANDSAANRQLNRRVEIVISEDGRPIRAR